MLKANALLVKEGMDKLVWGERIIDSEYRGKFSRVDIKRANNWETCAIGENTSDVKVSEDGEPDDKDLTDLGNEFHTAVWMQDFLEAASLLVQIEKAAKSPLPKE
tara:strand:+ start:2039 stop:2353 length:315 start_codon:yes stop_codon:yes gene_type:complete